MIRPFVFDETVPYDEDMERMVSSPTLVSLVFVSDKSLDPVDAMDHVLTYLRSFTTGMVAEGETMSFVVDVDGRRNVQNISYKSSIPEVVN